MKRLYLTLITVLSVFLTAFGLILMINSPAVKASAEIIAGVTPVFSATKYKLSTEKEGMLIATGIKNVQDVYEVGYEFDGEFSAVTSQKTKYYTAIKSGGNTWTVADLFGNDYDGMIVWEIQYDCSVDYEFNVYAKVGNRVDGDLVETDNVVRGTTRYADAEELNVTLNYGGNSEKLKVAYGKKITGYNFNPNSFYKDGYEYVWKDNSDNEFDLENDVVTENITLTYTEKQCAIVESKSTEYKIVKPADAKEFETYAANFLSSKIKESTGVTVPIITDSGLTWNKTAKYISVGDTTIYRTSGVSASSSLGSSGYVVQAKGCSVIISGYQSQGTYYGAMDFAERKLGYKYYAKSSETIDAKSEVTVGNLSFSETPSFDTRFIGYNENHWDYVNKTGNAMGLKLNYPLFNGSFYGVAHSTTDYLSYSKYPYSSYKAYYADSSSGMPCYSNINVRNILYEGIKNSLEAHPETDGEYIYILGGPDKATHCKCSTCKNKSASYYLVDCANYIAKKLQSYFLSIGSSRKLILAVSSYFDFEEPPKGIQLYGGSNVKVGAIYTPIRLNYHAPITDSVNSTYKNRLDGWASLCAANKSLMIYDYCVNYSHTYANLDNFRSLQANYQYYKQKGAIFVYSQGLPWHTGNTPTACFYNYRNYLQSELMWNVNADESALKTEFFNAYYGLAASYMLNYYNELVSLYASNYNNYSELRETTGSIYFDMYQSKYFPQATLNRWKGYIESAYNAIDGLKATDAALYKTLYSRICLESVSVRYLLFKCYNSLSLSEKTALYNDMVKFNCVPNESTANGNFTSVASELDIYGYVLHYYKQASRGSLYYEEIGLGENLYAAHNDFIDVTEYAKSKAPDGYYLDESNYRQKLTGTNTDDLILAAYYDFLPAKNVIDAEDHNDIKYLAKKADVGAFDMSIVSYSGEPVSAPTYGGTHGIKITNSSTGYPIMEVLIGNTLAAGSKIEFDFACYDPNGASGHFGLIVNGTWYDLNNQGAYHWDLSGKWKHYTLTLAKDTDVISLGANFGSGTWSGVTDVAAVALYFDNIGVSQGYTVTTYTQNVDGSSYSDSSDAVYALKGVSVDYTSIAEENVPIGYVLNTEKSVLKGTNNGSLVIKVYYDLVPAKMSFDFESASDLEYTAKNAYCGDFDLSIVSYSGEPVSAPHNGGEKGIKLTNSATGYPTVDIALGKTAAAGSKIEFDFACYDPNGASGHFGLIVNGTWYDLNNQGAYHWNLNGTWIHYTVTLAKDTDVISLGANFGSGTWSGVTDVAAVALYFDNIVVNEQLLAKTSFDFESAGDLSYVTTSVGSAEIIDISDMVVGSTGCSNLGNAAGNVLKATNADNTVTINLGKTVAAGTTVELDFALTVPSKKDLCTGSNFVEVTISGQGYQYWHFDGKFRHATVTLSAATDKITFSFGLNNLTFTIGTITDEIKAETEIYIDNLVVTEP